MTPNSSPSSGTFGGSPFSPPTNHAKKARLQAAVPVVPARSPAELRATLHVRLMDNPSTKIAVSAAMTPSLNATVVKLLSATLQLSFDDRIALADGLNLASRDIASNRLALVGRQPFPVLRNV